MRIQKVKWRDSQLHITQESRGEDWSVCEIESVGFVLEKDGDKVVLAGDLVNEDVRRVIVIPKENVIEIKSLIK